LASIANPFWPEQAASRCATSSDADMTTSGKPLKNHCGADFAADMLSGALAHLTSFLM
jgi:hypothetical protein